MLGFKYGFIGCETNNTTEVEGILAGIRNGEGELIDPLNRGRRILGGNPNGNQNPSWDPKCKGGTLVEAGRKVGKVYGDFKPRGCSPL